MKKRQWLTALALALTLMMGLAPAGATDSESIYPVDTDVTLTYVAMVNGVLTQQVNSLGETPLGQAWMERTGINVEFEHPANNDAINLRFASLDLPDIVEFNWGPSYSGGPAKAILDGLILPWSDEMKAYAPNFMGFIEENLDKGYDKRSVTPSGEYFGFPFIRNDPKLLTSGGMIIRNDWLADLGLEAPSTLEELENALTRFRDEKGAAVPMSLTIDNLGGNGLILGAFGVARDQWYVEDGVIKYGRFEEGYLEFLEYLKKLYDEKLLDNNFATLDNATMMANMFDGKTGVVWGALGGGIGNYLSTMETKDPTFDVIGMPYPTMNKGEKAMTGNYSDPFTGKYATISPTSGNVELAMAFLDYCYSEEGYMLMNFGIEGVSYEMIDGYPTYTDLVEHNPDGLTFQQGLSMYTRAWDTAPMIQDPRYIEQYAGRPQQQIALENWMNTDAGEYAIPILTIPTEDASEFASIMNDIGTTAKELSLKYITGSGTLDGYMDTLRSMGMERAIEIEQAAYDEFMNR